MNAGRAVGLLLGVAADAVFGDMWRPAPRKECGHRGRVTTASCVLGGALVIGTAAERSARRDPALQAITTAAGVLIVLRAKRLGESGTRLVRALGSGDHDEAHAHLTNLSDEDTRGLGEHGLARVSVESVAENTVHAVVAPLFWGALAGVPGLLGYAVVRSLRPSPRRSRRGGNGVDKTAETINVLANAVPARMTAVLTVTCAPVVGGSASSAFRTWRADANAHPDGNDGHAVSAVAGALQVRLGGRSGQGAGGRPRPVVGDGRTPDSGDVTRCVELSRVIGWTSGVVAAIVAVALPRRLPLRRRRRQPRP